MREAIGCVPSDYPRDADDDGCLPWQMWRACAFDRTTLICQRVLPGMELLSMRVFGLDTTAAII
jgi:hypothetical protein